MNLAERRGLRLFTFSVLYLAQGIPWGFTAITLPAYLAKRGVDGAAVAAVLAMTTLPYSFKWAWGPLIDAFASPRFGRRRPWIVFAQGMMALTIATMLAIPNVVEDVELLTLMVFVHTIFNSIQDAAVDALAVDLLNEAERGSTNGVMWASKYIGGLIGGAALPVVIRWSGLRAALVVQVIMLGAIMLVPLFVRERGGPLPPRRRLDEVFVALWQALRVRSALTCALVMVTATVASGLLTVTAAILFTQQLAWTDTEYSEFVSLGLLIGAAAALAGGFVADRVGHRRLAMAASAGLAVLWIGFALAEPLWTNRVFVYSLIAIEPICLTTMTVALFAVCMDVAVPTIAATQFTAYMSLYSIATTFGYKLAGRLADWDVKNIYIAAAVIQLAVTVLMLLVDPKETRAKLSGAG